MEGRARSPITRPCKALAVALLIASGPLAGSVCLAAEPHAVDTTATDDIYRMVAAIAEPTARARLGGDNQKFEKVATIGRDTTGATVVTSIQARAADADPDLPDGTVGIMIVHYDGQCSTPYGNDGAALRMGVETYVASPSGKHIWQVASRDGASWIRLVRGIGDFDGWEALQAEPSHYNTYACAKYE